MSDLSLIPIGDLIKEIASRCDYYVLAHHRKESGVDVYDIHFDGHYLKTLGLCSEIAHDIRKTADEYNNGESDD